MFWPLSVMFYRHSEAVLPTVMGLYKTWMMVGLAARGMTISLDKVIEVEGLTADDLVAESSRFTIG